MTNFTIFHDFSRFFTIFHDFQLAITNEGDAEAVGLSIVNTIIGGCGGGLVALTITHVRTGKWSYLVTLNGALTGMVGQCAGCNVFDIWAAALVGCMGGVVFHGVHDLMLKLRMDDPLDAVAVHCGGGILGVLAAPFFSSGDGIFWVGNTVAPWKTLGINIGGLLAIIAWAAFWSTAMFGSLFYFGFLRIDRETEFKGNDIVKHGESAYPRDAWVEMQYSMKNQKQTGSGNKNEGELPPHMRGTSGDAKDEKAYNNAFEMMPGFAALHSASQGMFSSVAMQQAQKKADEGQDNRAVEIKE